MTDTFTSLYEAWVLGKKRSNDLAKQLSSRCRQAWESGDEHDRYLALNFDQRNPDAFDLVVEGMDDADPEIAKGAAVASRATSYECPKNGPRLQTDRRFVDLPFVAP